MGTKANINTNKRKDHKRTHNHFPQGKTGYIPQGTGITDLNLLKR